MSDTIRLLPKPAEITQDQLDRAIVFTKKHTTDLDERRMFLQMLGVISSPPPKHPRDQHGNPWSEGGHNRGPRA